MNNRIFIRSLLVAISFTLVVGCNQAGNDERTPPSPEVLKAQLREQEENNPTEYLKVTGTMSENRVQTRAEGLFHEAEYATDGYTIYSTIQNTATVARFKDVRVVVKFLSKTNTVIATEEFVQYEFYEPNSNSDFTLHVYPPDEMEQWSIEVKQATPVQ